MKVSIGIKALNEERHIGAALASAVAAVQPFGGEVILADSGSTDRTVDIARQYPVHIVQLANPSERSCGAGAQLAFQFAQGDYFYLLDGDMVIDPDFLSAGIAYLETHPDVAAVGGRVREMVTDGQEFQIRARSVAQNSNWQPGIVDRLDCGGLYRTEAIRDAGYFADRNLHAFEEFELAARLRARGWKLARINAPAVEHYGHSLDSYKLLWRRIASGYAGASGEVLRGALGQRHLPVVLRRFGHLRNGLAVMIWWLMLPISLLLPLPLAARAGLFLLLLLAPVAVLSIRRGSFKLGLYSLTAWNVSTLGLFTGFFRKRTPPRDPLGAKVLATPVQDEVPESA